MRIKEKTILVLGATGGIGSGLCDELYHQGARLAVAAFHDEERLEKKAKEWQAYHQKVDSRDIDQVQIFVESVQKSMGPIYGAVNCTGSILLKPAHMTRAEEWNDTIALNLTSSFALVRACTRFMRSEGGSIVLLSSAAARLGLANHEAIAAAKAGVIGLTKSAAATYASQKIRVNCIAPGLVDTRMSERITSSENALKSSLAMHPLHRIGKTNDIKRALMFFLDPENDWITGQTLGVDGGLAEIK
jgi:NAD(P)-dependent dehydrogenase (short-subunit alcohol dehydrogenase family)